MLVILLNWTMKPWSKPTWKELFKYWLYLSMAILLLKIADPLEVNKITIKCIFQLDEIMEYGNKCVALMSKVLAVKDCNGIMSTTSSLRSSSSKWCSTLVWRLIIFAYEHYCQHKVRRIMVANYRVKLKTIRWKDVTYKQDASYLMRSCFLHILLYRFLLPYQIF